jgi:hypothetical protein
MTCSLIFRFKELIGLTTTFSEINSWQSCFFLKITALSLLLC